MKLIIRILWFIPTFALYVPIRNALESVQISSLVTWLFNAVYVLFVYFVPSNAFIAMSSKTPKGRAKRIANLIMGASSDYCKKAGLPDRMSVHIQVWCVYLYAMLPIIGENPVKQYINHACRSAMYRAYNISLSDHSAHEAFSALQYTYLMHLAEVEFDPHESNAISTAFDEFWLGSLTRDEDGFDLFPLLENQDHALVYEENLAVLEKCVTEVLA